VPSFYPGPKAAPSPSPRIAPNPSPLLEPLQSLSPFTPPWERYKGPPLSKKPKPEPLTRGKGEPLPSPGPTPKEDLCRECFKKRKEQRKPRKAREKCFTGIYNDRAKGIVKHPGKEIPCQ